MSHIRKYGILIKNSPQDIANAVSGAIGRGWIPLGGISMAQESANPKRGIVEAHMVFAQAMILPHRSDDPFRIGGDSDEAIDADSVPDPKTESANN